MEPIVTINPNVMHGTPCFAGTRVEVQTFFDHLEAGYTLDGFVEQFPTVRREQVVGIACGAEGGCRPCCGACVKLLLDENLPHQIRLELPGHQVFTAAFMKWHGNENGELPRLAAANGFDVLNTNDRGLEYQQNLDALPVAVVVVLAKANTIEAIRPVYPELLAALMRIQQGEFMKLVVV